MTMHDFFFLAGASEYFIIYPRYLVNT